MRAAQHLLQHLAGEALDFRGAAAHPPPGLQTVDAGRDQRGKLSSLTEPVSQRPRAAGRLARRHVGTLNAPTETTGVGAREAPPSEPAAGYAVGAAGGTRSFPLPLVVWVPVRGSDARCRDGRATRWEAADG